MQLKIEMKRRIQFSEPNLENDDTITDLEDTKCT